MYHQKHFANIVLFKLDDDKENSEFRRMHDSNYLFFYFIMGKVIAQKIDKNILMKIDKTA